MPRLLELELPLETAPERKIFREMSEHDPKLKNVDSDDTMSVVEVHGSVKREKGDPKVGMEPVSLWVFYIAAIILMVGAGYGGSLYGGFGMEDLYIHEGYVSAPRPVGSDGSGEVQQMSPELWIAKGKKAYANCGACHMANGLGSPGIYPPLAGSEWVSGPTERIGVAILKGLAGPMTVKGQPYAGSVPMPPWEAALSDVQLAQVMSYIRNTWGNSGSIVTRGMAASVREKYLGQNGPWSEAKLLEIPDDAVLPGEEVTQDDPETWVHLEE